MTNLSRNSALAEDFRPAQANWHVLWTHSNHESSVYEQLCAKGYEVFFARIDQWVASKKGKHLVRVPMFRSYLFIHHAIDKYDYIDICKTKGLVRILGDRFYVSQIHRLASNRNQPVFGMHGNVPGRDAVGFIFAQVGFYAHWRPLLRVETVPYGRPLNQCI